jgi:hypothetical protein
MKVLVSLVLALALIRSAAADPVQNAGNNFHEELTSCAAYFAISAQCLRNRDPKVPLAPRLDAAFDQTLKLMHAMQQEIGMNNAAAEARMRMRTNGQMTAIGNSCVNISILLEKHGKVCRDTLNDPKAGLERHFEDEMKRTR